MKRYIIIALLFVAYDAAAQLNPAFIPVIPTVAGTDVFYTYSRGRLYKISVDSLLAYIDENGSGGGGTDDQNLILTGDVLTIEDGAGSVDLSSYSLGDGDKGDITVSSSGANWQIDANAVGATEIIANAVGSSELASTSVSAGSYTNANITIDADGRITTASDGSAGGGVSDGDKGDITVSSSGANWQIDANTVGATEIAANAVGSSELASTSVSAGNYTNANITVDADGRITTASSGNGGGGPGSGTSNRVAYWNTASTLGSFPLELNVSNTRFTQSTGVRLPRGVTSAAPAADQGFIRFDTTIDQFVGCRDDSTYEIFDMGGGSVETSSISSSSTVSPSGNFFVRVTGSGSKTLTINASGISDGTTFDLLSYTTGTTTVATSGSETFRQSNGAATSTINVTSSGLRCVFYNNEFNVISTN